MSSGGAVLVSVCDVAIQRILQLVILLLRSTEFKELEILVLRHELAILRRHVHRPAFRPADRVFLTAASGHGLLPRVKWPTFLVTPASFCAGTGAWSRGIGHMRDSQVDRRSTPPSVS
jgi:putative transposase